MFLLMFIDEVTESVLLCNCLRHWRQWVVPFATTVGGAAKVCICLRGPVMASNVISFVGQLEGRIVKISQKHLSKKATLLGAEERRNAYVPPWE